MHILCMYFISSMKLSIFVCVCVFFYRSVPNIGNSVCHIVDALDKQFLKKCMLGPGWVCQLVRASSRYAKVSGSIPGQGTYKNQPMHASTD